MTRNQQRLAESMPTKPAANPLFSGQHEGEDVVFVFRQHPVVMRRALIFGLLVVLLVLSPLAVPAVYEWPGVVSVLTKFAFVAPIIVCVYWFYHWVVWYYTIYIVTVERLVQIHQRGLFRRDVEALFHGRVHALKFSIPGLYGHLFHFGDIQVLTEVGNFNIRNVPHPEVLHERILEVIRDNRDRFDDEDHDD